MKPGQWIFEKTIEKVGSTAADPDWDKAYMESIVQYLDELHEEKE